MAAEYRRKEKRMSQETYEMIRLTVERCFGILDIVIFRVGLIALSAIGAYKLIRGK